MCLLLLVSPQSHGFMCGRPEREGRREPIDSRHFLSHFFLLSHLDPLRRRRRRRRRCPAEGIGPENKKRQRRREVSGGEGGGEIEDRKIEPGALSRGGRGEGEGMEPKSPPTGGTHTNTLGDKYSPLFGALQYLFRCISQSQLYQTLNAF